MNQTGSAETEPYRTCGIQTSQEELNRDVLFRRREFKLGGTVYTQNFGSGEKWLSRVVQKTLKPVCVPLD